MTSALVAGTEKMNILRMVLGVKRTIALVCDLEQHSCNMARDHKFNIRDGEMRGQLQANSTG